MTPIIPSGQLAPAHFALRSGPLSKESLGPDQLQPQAEVSIGAAAGNLPGGQDMQCLGSNAEREEADGAHREAQGVEGAHLTPCMWGTCCQENGSRQLCQSSREGKPCSVFASPPLSHHALFPKPRGSFSCSSAPGNFKRISSRG